MEGAKEKEESQVHFMQLPFEAIEEILKCSVLTIKDVLNFSFSCRYYRSMVVGSNSLWKQKYWDRWSDFEDSFEGGYIENYLNEISLVYTTYKRAQALLEAMPSRFCKKYEISESEMKEWTELLNEKAENYMYLTSYLMDIVNTEQTINTIQVVALNTPGNKTTQYYANKVLRHIRQVHLTQEWFKYRELPPNEQLLEVGAVFVAQWCQPNIQVTAKKVGKTLDNIANSVKHRLKCINPDHGIFTTDKKVLEKCRKYNLENTLWEPHEARQLINAMKEILFDVMEYSGNNVAYYMPQNSFINEVLEYKQGLPITLAVIYESVARRLGVKCEPINFPSHFLLRFRDGPTDCYYIDVFNGGNIVKKGVCRFAQNIDNKPENLYSAASAMQVVERMANNLEVSARQHTQVNGRVTRLRSSLELLKLVNPQDISALVSLARLYMLHSMDTQPLEQFLLQQQFDVPEQAQRVVHMLRGYHSHPSRVPPEQSGPVKATGRTPALKFAVGMVMTHLGLDYKCVIYDWDLECLASDDWQDQMRVDSLRLGRNQPFYNVLVEDGSHRYVAQENLQPTTDTGFLYLNADVGRHFSHFYQTHYVPNQDKEGEYPEDRKTRTEFHEKFLLNEHD